MDEIHVRLFPSLLAFAVLVSGVGCSAPADDEDALHDTVNGQRASASAGDMQGGAHLSAGIAARGNGSDVDEGTHGRVGSSEGSLGPLQNPRHSEGVSTLGDGAVATWLFPGDHSVDAKGESAGARVLVTGRASDDMHVHVRVWGHFGYLRRTVIDEVILVPAGGQRVLTASLDALAKLHAHQKDYPTRLDGHVEVVSDAGEPFFGSKMKLATRFVAFGGANSDQPARVLDAGSFRAQYPWGLTTDDAELLAAAEAGQESDGIDLGYAPGLGRLGSNDEPRPLPVAGEVGRAACSGNSGNAYNARVCINYETAYNDTNGSDDVWDDNDALTRLAHGVRVRITRDGGSGSDLWYGYTSGFGGCTPWLDVASGDRPLRVRVYSQADEIGFGDHEIDLRNDDQQEDRYYRTLTSNWSPGTNTTCYYTWKNSSSVSISGGGSGTTSDVVNIMAAATHVLYNQPGRHTNDEYQLYNDDCSSGGSCARDDGNSTARANVYISDFGNDRKYIMAHEIGHAQGILENEGKRIQTTSDLAYDPVGDNCVRITGTHEMMSKEWQKTAAKEGFAHFFAATIWNHTTENDCDFGYYKEIRTWSATGTWIGIEDNPWVDCESGGDHLHNVCYADRDARGTEYDWLRFFWDMHTDDGLEVPFNDLAQILDYSNPHSWNEDDGGSSSDDVVVRLNDKAEQVLSDDDFIAWEDEMDDNGVGEK